MHEAITALDQAVAELKRTVDEIESKQESHAGREVAAVNGSAAH